MTYEELRHWCIRYWGFHPETKGTIRELWAEINKRPGVRRTIAEPSAYLLFDRMAEFADSQSAASRDSHLTKEK